MKFKEWMFDKKSIVYSKRNICLIKDLKTIPISITVFINNKKSIVFLHDITSNIFVQKILIGGIDDNCYTKVSKLCNKINKNIIKFMKINDKI